MNLLGQKVVYLLKEKLTLFYVIISPLLWRKQQQQTLTDAKGERLFSLCLSLSYCLYYIIQRGVPVIYPTPADINGLDEQYLSAYHSTIQLHKRQPK